MLKPTPTQKVTAAPGRPLPFAYPDRGKIFDAVLLLRKLGLTQAEFFFLCRMIRNQLAKEPVMLTPIKTQASTVETAAASKQDITALFTDTTIFADKKKIKGVTVEEVKNKLRGKVPASQPKFMDFIEGLGLKTDWSHTANAYVVHASTTPLVETAETTGKGAEAFLTSYFNKRMSKWTPKVKFKGKFNEMQLSFKTSLGPVVLALDIDAGSLNKKNTTVKATWINIDGCDLPQVDNRFANFTNVVADPMDLRGKRGVSSMMVYAEDVVKNSQRLLADAEMISGFLTDLTKCLGDLLPVIEENQTKSPVDWEGQ